MTIKVDRHTRKVGHIDHVDQVSLPRLHMDCIVLTVVDEPRLRNGSLTRHDGVIGDISRRLIVIQKRRHLLMVPIRECHRDLLIEVVRKIGVMDDQRSS